MSVFGWIAVVLLAALSLYLNPRRRLRATMSTDYAGDGLREAVEGLKSESWARYLSARGVGSQAVWQGRFDAFAEVIALLAEHPATPDDGSCCAEMTPHTRTSTPRGPDFCQECSAAVGDWVQWPCPATPARPAEVEDDGTLTKAERESIRDSLGWEWDEGDGVPSVEDCMAETIAAVERIVAAREREAAERAGERIAQAIEADRWLVSTPKAHAARIARAEARP